MEDFNYFEICPSLCNQPNITQEEKKQIWYELITGIKSRRENMRHKIANSNLINVFVLKHTGHSSESTSPRYGRFVMQSRESISSLETATRVSNKCRQHQPGDLQSRNPQHSQVPHEYVTALARN